MASATKATTERGGGGGALLKGSDLKPKEQSVTVFVHNVREAPEEWQSALVMDIEETHGCTAFALNKTNTKKLVQLIGDDFDDWAGYDVTLVKVRTNNPKTGQAVDGLEVESVKRSKKKIPSDAN